MATTDSNVHVNGSYGAYDTNNYAAASANNVNEYAPAQQQQPASTSSSVDIPKDEVGWYFVETYYTTLSKNPEKLYLYYNKRSQFVSGNEEEKVPVCVGQKAINDRIKQLEFQDTKVRVTNVDSQGSDANIVIQVIGEISNKGQPHRRFVQTFVLAAQTNGYFLLNDIFRYLADEPEEEIPSEEQEPAVPSGVHEPAPSAAPEAEAEKQGQEEVAQSEEDLVKVDQKLEETAQEEPAPEAAASAVNGSPAPETKEPEAPEEAPAAPVEEAPSAEPEAPAAEEKAEPEVPKESTPTPAPEAQKPAAPAAPAAAPKPAVPRTWASLAASAHKVVAPVLPQSLAPAAQQAQTQSKAPAAAPSQPTAAPAAQSSAPARETSPSNSQGDAGWQSVSGHKKEQSRSQNQAPAAEDSKRAYIKNVYSQVQEPALRAALSKFGEITWLDINRGKNCAFVDFKTLASFQAAVNANPHHVNGVDLTIEERRMRPQSFQPFPRGGARGRGGMGNQAPRGGFNPRGGRGGAGARGGRPAAQEA